MPTRPTPSVQPRGPPRAVRPAGPRSAADRAFPIVGVGASAGGLDAYRQLLAHVPADVGLALVLVQHLDATRASRLSETLAHATSMRVTQAEEGDRVEPNRVYVIPPGARLAIEEGVLKLSPLSEDERRPHLPIDFFLQSLAADLGRLAIGVVLSGNASDGTAGLAAIRAQGGITFAQDPGSARFGAMPRSAVSAGAADFCLPLPELAAELARLARHPYLAPRELLAPSLAGAGRLSQVVGLVRSATGVDFGEHKPATFRRRLARRMAVRNAADLASYLEALRRDPAEVQALFDDLLVNVTSFFGDEGAFDELRAVAFPAILRHKPPGAPVRAWVVGCATGEEVYSLAIAFLEHLGDGSAVHPLLVFGSDLSERAIQVARAGLYPDSAVRGLGEGRLRRYFVRSERGWRVHPKVRELCVFVRHDVARDPPFARLDLVSCRNVLVTFGQALRRRVLAAAHYALQQPGYLLLGRSESASGTRWFTPTRKRSRLLLRRPGRSSYRFVLRSRRSGSGAGPSLPRSPRQAPGDPRGRTPPSAVAGAARRALEEELLAAREQVAALLEEHGRGTDALATANQKLISSNEELQSLNEELETAKEELQATNEELTTVNDELHGRNQELQLVNADVLNLLDAVEIPIVILDADLRVRRFTRRGAEFLGLTPGDAGRRITRVALPFRAPDLERWIARAMAEAILVEGEVQDHLDRWHRLQVRPHRAADGHAGGAVLSLVDIDRLRHEVHDARWARDYASSIVEAVQVPLVVLDAGLRVLSANAAYYRLFQVQPAETEGHGLFELAGGAWDTAEVRQAVAGVLAGRGPFQALGLERVLPRAGRRTTSLSGCAVVSPGEPMVLLALEDVTEQRAGERHRADLLALAEDARKRAERADSAKDLFLAGLSHELRTPLSVILLQAQILQQARPEAAAVVRAASLIEANARRQAKLIDDLLDLSRIATGKLRLSVEELDWRRLVAEVVEGAQPEAEALGVQLTADGAGGPAACRGDPVRLHQVVANLVANAIHFTPRGGRVDVRVDAADGIVRLVVSDTGRGIDPEFLPRVFQRFAQEDPARQARGMGLGLSIVHDLVELHGGTVRAESPGRGRGATFTVALPGHAAAAGG